MSVTFDLNVAAPEEWEVSFHRPGKVYVELAEAAAARTVTGKPGRVLVIAKRPDGALLMQERDWTEADEDPEPKEHT